LNNLKVLKIWEFRSEVVESLLKDVVHYWSTTDPELLASRRQDFVQECLVPSATLLA